MEENHFGNDTESIVLFWHLEFMVDIRHPSRSRQAGRSKIMEKPGHEDQKIGNDGIYTILKPWNLDEISYRGNVDEKEES